MREEVENFTSSRGKFKYLKESGRREILRVHMYSFCLYFYFFLTFKFFCNFYGHELCCVGRTVFIKLTDKLMFGVQENQSFLHVIC